MAQARMARTSGAFARTLRRHPLLAVSLAVTIMLAAVGLYRGTEAATGSSASPADLFMQSIANDDADLGWAQLCQDVQGVLTQQTLEQQVLAQRAIQDQQGMTLSVEHIGDRPRPAGGELHIYVATARGANGAAGQKTYVIETQLSGCVEAVQ